MVRFYGDGPAGSGVWAIATNYKVYALANYINCNAKQFRKHYR